MSSEINTGNSISHALDKVNARISDIPVDVRKTWNPETCSEELLPWLAWGFSLSTWKSNWDEKVKRERIRSAIEIQREKGTANSVREVVKTFGSSLAIREWWQKATEEDPFSFELTITSSTDVNQSAEYQQDIIEEVNRNMPVRCQFRLISGNAFNTGVGITGRLRPMNYYRTEVYNV